MRTIEVAMPDEQGVRARNTTETRKGKNVSRELSPEKLLDALSDPYSREIIAATSTTPASVDEIIARCSMSAATAYRKVNQLTDAGILEEHVRVRPESTNFREFSLRLRHLQISLDGDGTPRATFY